MQAGNIRQRSIDHGKPRIIEQSFRNPVPRQKHALNQFAWLNRPYWLLKSSGRRWINLFMLLVLSYAGIHYMLPDISSGKPKQVLVAKPPNYKRSNQCFFEPSPSPLPVYTEPQQILYHNGPMSSHRPAHQFSDCTVSAPSTFGRPAITLITATKDPGPNFDLSLANVQGQSMQNFRWVIIDDHSNNATSLERLKGAARDSRIMVVQNAGEGGLAASRNLGLEAIKNHTDLQAPYVAMLDDDDLYELTTLEKTVWMLESNPQWTLGAFYFVKFGAQNTSETRGVHDGIANYLTENYVANAAVIRRDSIEPCKYDTSFDKGGEDWDFWLCLADNDKWGGTLPELAYWYRANDKAFRQERWGDTFDGGQSKLRKKIQQKHTKHEEDIESFPVTEPPPSVALEPFSWKSPFENEVANTASKGNILLIIPWLFVGGADIGALRMVETLTKHGYRITVVCTLYKSPEGLELRPQMMKWTHDIHVLPSFLRAHDFPRYIKYLADTRKADTIFLSNSMLAYEMLPALREQLPQVMFVDYVHNEAYDGWKSGGYPTYSVLHQRYLDRTISCSYHLKSWMVERGHAEDRIGVVKLGVDLEQITAPDAEIKPRLKKHLYGVDEDTRVILSVARLDPQKRTLLILDIISELAASDGFSCGRPDSEEGETSTPLLMVMVGSGNLEKPLNSRIRDLGMEDCFHLAGVQTNTLPYYQSADLFLLPSMSEGISVAVSEAMAAGLPIVAADAGALPEQIGRPSDTDQAGFVVTQHLDDDDSDLYARALARLLVDEVSMKRFSINGRRRVQKADWHTTLLQLLPELETAKVAHTSPRSIAELQALPHPAAHLALQTQLNEFKPYVDFSLIHSSLSQTTRSGFGRELQSRCGENADNRKWFNALEEPKFCHNANIEDSFALQQSAKHQCGFWCVWDLRTEKRKGWVFKCVLGFGRVLQADTANSGSCFARMEGITCQEHFAFRPRKTLEDEG